MTAVCAGCATHFRTKKDLLASKCGIEHVRARKISTQREWQFSLEARSKHRKVHHLCDATCDKEVNAAYTKMKKADSEFKTMTRRVA